jgi:hypothetical protein
MDGDPIPDYYPKIVDKGLFLRAKQGRVSRDFRDQYAGKGRRGEFVSNLFSGLARCAHCHGPMRYENKGPRPKGGAYLVCDRVKRGLGCANQRWEYNDFEASFLLFVKELDLKALLTPHHAEDQNAIAVEVLNGRLAVLREHQEKTHQLFLDGGSEQSFVARKLAEYDEQIRQIDSELRKARAASATTKAAADQFSSNRDEIKALVARLQKRPDEETRKVRGRYIIERAIPGWTTSMAGEPDIGMLPDGTLNVVHERD